MHIPIINPDDSRIEAYRAIRERDLVGRDDRFIAEGEVVLRVLLTQSPFSVESLLIGENRVEALADILARVPQSIPIYVANRAVMDAIVGFPIHRGILAVGLRPPAPTADTFLSELPERALVVGLIGLANHDNVGGIFRNAAAFGADAVIFDGATADPLYRKAIRVSVGAALRVPHLKMETGADMIDALRRADFEIISLSPSGQENLTQIRRAPRTALLLGAEGPGLPAALLASTRSVSIPMRDGFDSLNVATTSGIVLHHLTAYD